MKLATLEVSENPVTDLSPLNHMPLEHLAADDCGSLVDFDTLATLHRLSHLTLKNTLINDLSDLKGLPLTTLNVSGTPVTDLTPLSGMKLTSLHVRSKDKLTAASLTLLEQLQKKG